MRRLLGEHGLAQPGVVEYLEGGIPLRWHERKLEVVIDEIPEDEPVRLDWPAGLDKAAGLD
jgi:hypothetical protein